MGLIGYLILGALAYIAGIVVFQKRIRHKIARNDRKITHPVIACCVLGCLVIMLIVSFLIGRFILAHKGIDIAYILVNSLVATVVFYFGLNPDETNMKLPD